MPNNPATRRAGAATQVAAGNRIVRRQEQAAALSSVTSTTKDSLSEPNASTPDVGPIPVGLIVMWSGLLANVPAGWALCDGTGGTPDLRDRFIYGWTAGVDPGATGGAINHSHAVGTLANSSVSAGTPAGTLSAPTFTGSSVSTSSNTAGTPSGTVTVSKTTGTFTAGAVTALTDASATFAGDALGNHSHAVTAAGTVSTPTFTGSALAGHTHAISGSTATADGRPPYFKLAFIIKT